MFLPNLTLVFAERLYQVEHPRFVKLVDEVCNVAEGESGYWISKKWYKGIEFIMFN
jgi:ubiquitin carboxyl-terminal hydrolase 48